MLKANNLEMRMKNLLLKVSCNSQSQPVQKQKETVEGSKRVKDKEENF